MNPSPNWIIQNGEIDRNLLKSASSEEQKEALLEWFYNKYEEPCESLPYISREGGYQYIYGPPVEPEDVLYDFDEEVSEEVIKEVIEKLTYISDAWSPIPEPSGLHYDLPIPPLSAFRERTDSALKLIYGIDKKNSNYELFKMSIFSLLFAVFETYLWEVTIYYLENTKISILKNLIVHNNKSDVKEKIVAAVQNFYREHNNDVEKLSIDIEKIIKNKLANEIIWHNEDNIKYVFKQGFRLNRTPDFKPIKKLLRTRNNIIHRFGLNTDGNKVDISSLEETRDTLFKYCEQLDKSIKELL
jgi:hypothetical protein